MVAPSQTMTEMPVLGDKVAALMGRARSGAGGLRTRAFNGMRHLGSVPVADLASTSRETVWSRDKITLYRYRPATPTRETPILLVMSLVTRSYVFDLRPGSSLVEDLLAAGYEVYLLDWGIPDAADARNDLSTYCDEYIPRAVDAVRASSAAESVHVLGYCLGGILVLLTAAGNPQLPIASLVLLAAPLDLAKMQPLPTMFAEGRLDAAHVVDDTGNVPADTVKEIFSMMQPTAKLTTLASMWTSTANDEATAAHQALIGWSNDHVPFPGAAFTEMIDLVLRQSRLVSGRIPIGGRTVDLADISCPVLNVTGSRDTLVPMAANEPVADALQHADLDHLSLPAGHAGLFVGSSARKKCVPSILSWLDQR